MNRGVEIRQELIKSAIRVVSVQGIQNATKIKQNANEWEKTINFHKRKCVLTKIISGTS